ncbi:MAG: benenodin family lasso peptide [Pseudomonadota bacterium]|nr:benenodin family lasso peptide [Pseudomonadota bacterium]
MDRETNDLVDLIDLGVVSVETQGANKGDIDGVGLQRPLGLSDD